MPMPYPENADPGIQGPTQLRPVFFFFLFFFFILETYCSTSFIFFL